MEETEYFFALTPEKILSAVETSGIRCTGRCLTLNSMENRVYEVEIEVDDEESLKSVSERFRVIKFYRPGRWSEQQILEEHEFLLDLQAQDIPVVVPLRFADGKTLSRIPDINIFYAVFPKMAGRIPDELDFDQLERMGRLLARVHNIGAIKSAAQRIELTPTVYGRQNLEFLLQSNMLIPSIRERYSEVVENICQLTDELYRGVNLQRIHGDCHFGNILWGREGPFLVDFDDMVRGPCVQDLWLIIPGRDQESKINLSILVEAYESMRSFDRTTLSLIEPLRALRFIHFSAWIARRWKDPAFTRTFTEFGTERYWQTQLVDLEDQLKFIQSGNA